ncbi:MAG: TIGR02444 family protein [Geminicoccaceae bacterium]|nr:TIGR02444 family protein [Geminicoccaceae bacterium]MCB9944989.1 TIGR02444 family protein [Geminicoccaceae bacterium]
MSDPQPLWPFVITFYGKPGIARGLIALQDRHGLDVDLLLWGLWVGHECHHRLDDAQRRTARARVGSWQTRVMRPLREARRHIRDHAPLGEDEHERVDALREEVLELEIRLERVELDVLEAIVADCPSPSPMSPSEAHRLAMANLRELIRDEGIALGGEDEGTVAVIAAALRRIDHR